MRLPLTQEEASILDRVCAFLDREGLDSYIFGGYVRDALLGRSTRDIDIAVCGPALEVARRAAHALNGQYVPLDESRQIARVVLAEGDPAEGRRWHLDFSTIDDSIEKHLSQRDLTINAMAINTRELEQGTVPRVIDPLHGREDLQRGVIRQASDTAFEDCPVRLLRAVRLATEHSFAIEERTETAIRSRAHLITQVPGEAVREELCRLLSLSRAASHLYYLDRLGLLTAIFPELAATRDVEQPREHYWDVFQHSIETVAAFERLLRGVGNQEDAVLSEAPHIPSAAEHFEEEVSHGASRAVLAKLACLLHDIAKPQTKTVERDGRVRFLGHTRQGADMAGDILQRLRFSKREIKTVQTVIASHLRLWQMGGEGRPTRRAIYRFFRDCGDASIDVIFVTLADFLAARGPDLDLAEWKQHCEMMQYIWSEHEKELAVVPPEKLVDGHDLISIFHLEPGPRLGELLEAVREAQGVGEITTRDEALAFVRRRLAASEVSQT